jgi:hypothetical protein
LWEFDSLIPNQTAAEKLRYFRGIAQLVARFVRDEEAVGSNPAAPTKKDQTDKNPSGLFSSSQRDLNRAALQSKASNQP